MEDGDSLKRRRFWPVRNDVVGIAGQRPETERALSKIWPCVAAQRTLGKKFASLKDRRLHAIAALSLFAAM